MGKISRAAPNYGDLEMKRITEHALPDHALLEYALGGAGISCFPEDDPL